MRRFLWLAMAVVPVAPASAQTRSTLDINVIDVEGGNATLFVSPAHNGPAYWIKIAASKDGSFTVTNARNAFTKSYAPR